MPRFICLALLLVLSDAGAATANEFPSQLIRVTVPFAAGGINDVIARIVTQRLSENLKATIIIENRGGAGGTLGSAAVAQSAPDGYSLLFSSSSTMAVSPSIYKNLSYDPVKDFSPITQIATVASVLVVNPKLPVNSLEELIAYAKANPGKLTFGSGGVGAAQHLGAELLKKMAGLDMIHVPYRGGGPAVSDLIAGHLSFIIELMPVALPHIQQGSLRALAVSTPQRSAVLPNLPTIAETLPGYDLTIWLGLFAPRGTPPEIVKRLNKEMVDILRVPAMRERLAGQGAEPVGDTPEEFAAYVKTEIARWAAVVREAGIKPD